MIGSPNFMRGVYNASTSSSSDEKVVSASHHIQEYFEKFFEEHELHYELVDFNGRSDYESFIEKGIPAGGLFTGGELNKDDAGRAKYGGLTDAPHDPCYHKPCDTLDNVDPEVLLEMSRALAFVLYDLADNKDLRKFLEEGFP
jgi:Zn-dependent M28 family amino/carboxypeptidase